MDRKRLKHENLKKFPTLKWFVLDSGFLVIFDGLYTKVYIVHINLYIAFLYSLYTFFIL